MFVVLKQISVKVSTVRKYWLVVPVWIMIFGCARTSVPTGGPKDKEIPVLVESVPESGATNFRGNKIIISFNEYVVLDQITEKFMVSPPMKKRPDIFIKGKSIHIEYENELRDSTTYTFYFQDAIRDLNEGNAINNYQYVFSTGPFIDSLSVTGNVFSALDLDPPENTLVLLYNQPDDSSVVKQLPGYITRVEKNGEFRIDNVHAGTYRLYALVDADNSKNFNNRDELFAFYPDPVHINPEKNYLPVIKDTAVIKPVDGKIPFKPPLIGEYPLILFQAEKKLHYMTSSSRKMSYQITYTLSLPPDTMEFDFSIPGVPTDSYFIEKTRNHDTIIVWLTDSTVYNRSQIETIVRFPFTDTLGITGLKTDTIEMRYIAPRAPRSRAPKRVPYKVNGGISGQVRPDKRIILNAPAPFLPPDTSKLIFFELLKEEKTRHLYKLVKDTSNSCRYYVETDLKPGKTYLFIADSAAFISIYGEYSDSTGSRFSVMTPETFGKLILDISGYEGNRIIQLLDNTEKLVRQTYLTKNGKLEYPLLEKGFYRIRAIFDLNNDGKWTTGDFDTHRQPEPVFYYPAEIEIKENWEIIQPWEMTLMNFKEPKLQKINTSIR
jgi:hypothetical protein